MTTTRDELIWGHPGAPRVELIAGFGLVIAGAIAITAVTNVLLPDSPVAPVLSEGGLPILLVGAPGLVGAVGAYSRCGVVASLGAALLSPIGFVLTVIGARVIGIPEVGSGADPLWSITLAFAAAAVGFALVGYVVGILVRLVVIVGRYGYADDSDPKTR